jgi:hypothetical protein
VALYANMNAHALNNNLLAIPDQIGIGCKLKTDAGRSKLKKDASRFNDNLLA